MTTETTKALAEWRSAFETWHASDLRAHKYPVLDKECAWFVWAACARAALTAASEPAPVKAQVYCTVGQLREALQFMDAREDDSHETELVLATLPMRTSVDGEPMPDGLYVWLTDYPEEGCIGPLKSAPAPTAPAAPEAAPCDLCNALIVDRNATRCDAADLAAAQVRGEILAKRVTEQLDQQPLSQMPPVGSIKPDVTDPSSAWPFVTQAERTEALRKEFERVISAEPWNRPASRFPEDPTKSAWPGSYVSLYVDLAWHMFRAGAQFARPQAPAGCVLVPIEPTRSMCDVGMNAYDYARASAHPMMNRSSLIQSVWKAMIAAAPQQQGGEK